MKATHTSKYIPLLISAAGLAGILLRIALYTVGPDERGLISHTHPLHIACAALVLAVGIFLALTIRKMDGSTHYQSNFPANRQLLPVVILAPACFLCSAAATVSLSSDRVGSLWMIMGFAVVPCMAYTLYCQMTGKRCSFLFHGVICVYFALDMICRYRFWSGNPQLADYTFHLLSCAFLTLAAYYRTALCAGMGSRRMLLFTALMGIVCSMLSCVGPESLFRGPDQLLRYLGGALWAAGSMCTLSLPPRRKRQSIQEET